jgi:hypothetical protein
LVPVIQENNGTGNIRIDSMKVVVPVFFVPLPAGYRKLNSNSSRPEDKKTGVFPHLNN